MGTSDRPAARDAGVRARMSVQARRDTSPELALRSALHRRGLRFRVHRRPIPGLRREADLVFPRTRVAVFIDGCFWHACPVHGTWPRNNAEWWRAKLEGNRQRDAQTDARLADAGWLAVRVWEHEAVDDAANRIADVVRARRAPTGSNL